MVRQGKHTTIESKRERMDFSSAVQWWDEWQLRVLVLGSLFVQYFLFFSATVRRLPLCPWFRVFMWLAYLGGDALPIYSLAALFNRHKLQPATNESGLEVLWAPVLLIHLGGQHVMTAYNIEDNELWTRHAITAVSQIAVALYVFCKSWSGEKGLLQAAILLFVVGIVRTSQKPWALKSGSISSMVTSSSLSSRRRHNPVAGFCLGFNNTMGYLFSEAGREEEAAKEKDIPLEEFVKQACILVSELPSDQPSSQQEELGIYIQIRGKHHVYRLLVDISAPYSARIKNLQVFIAIGNQYAFQIRYMLMLTFMQLYTKVTLFGCTCICLHLLLPFLTIASVIIFYTSDKYYDYDAKDVKVTYILFTCTALLDFLAIFFIFCPGGEVFSKIYQYSLLSFYARTKTPTVLMKLAAVFCCKDYVNMHYYIDLELEPEFSPQIIGLVLGYVKDGWKEFIHDATTYRRFNNHSGQWTLRRHLLDSEQRLGGSLKIAFDRSVLVWHIATDLCFHHQTTTPHGQECAAQSFYMSHYMAYLLIIRPEMLMPGTRSGIFTVACDDVELMLAGELALDERGLAQEILRQAQQSSSLDTIGIGDLVPNACRLAEALMELCNEEERWKVIQGVWVEMLCYSAGRCRGYLHAKNMSEGTELLSRVWVLLSFMGMETFADRFQKPESPETEEGVEEGDGGEGRATKTEVDAIV